MAPGVARVPKISCTDRWQQRLRHPGQTILKEAECLFGLEGIDVSDLTTCETCHLSKAQRFVSREQRPIPNDPLDKIYVDIVEKATSSNNSHQYTLILPGAKTRMKWSLPTESKDKIALLLVQWARSRAST